MKTLLFILSIFLSPMAFAQHVTGTITDENNQPLSEASVYFDGSTIGTLSQKDASFKIDYKEQSNLTLIERYISNIITILGNNLKALKTESKTRFQKKIAVVYKGKQTDSSFKTNVFYVDDFGNHTHISHIIFSGEMSKSRLGEMLPKNYQPND